MTSPYNEKVNKLNTALENVYVKKADLIDELEDTLDGIDSTYQKQNMGVGYANKNVVTDSNGVITTEEKPIIPSASSTVPSADTTSGGSGSSSDFARADHIHPKSSLYASSSHTHTSLIETEIPPNSDLDTYITEGVFYYKNEQINAITNTPSTSVPFTLFVFYTMFIGSRVIIQQLIDVNANIFTRRRDIRGIWSDWVPLLSSNNISDNLTTNSATQVLSAKQGNVLKGLVDSKANNIHYHQQYFERENVLPLFSQILNSNITVGDIIDYFAEVEGYSTRIEYLNDKNITDFNSFINHYGGSIADAGFEYLQTVYEYNWNLLDADYLTDHCYYIYDDMGDNNYHLIRNYGSGNGFYYYGVVDSLNVPVDNLTTNSATQVLSAKQGKILNDKIGDILTIINGTGGGS